MCGDPDGGIGVHNGEMENFPNKDKIWKNKSNLNKVVVLSVDVRDV